MRINAKEIRYRQLNELIHRAVGNSNSEIILDNVNGQRYIGAGLCGKVKITVNGVPGNDLAAFMDGPSIKVHSNAQDGIGNTMNAGKITVCGSAGDIVGHSMRGGKIYIKGDVGYRVGIHMKAYNSLYPIVIVGGSAGDFLGEYMAGGLIIILGLKRNKQDRGCDQSIVGNYVGTGMHGGAIYIRGGIERYQLGKEVQAVAAGGKDIIEIEGRLKEYCRDFSLDYKEVAEAEFIKLIPQSSRPYGRLYAY